MWLSERVLYLLAKRCYNSEACLPPAMKASFETADHLDVHRRQFGTNHVLDMAARLGITLRDRVVVDFGCNTGAMANEYLQAGARRVIGVDVDPGAIATAQATWDDHRLEFRQSGVDHIPLSSASTDLILSHDTLEHVNRPAQILSEFDRILRPGGQALVGTWGWYHPFAPHLFATLPVPWAHVFFSERTMLRVCRRVYESSWYVPVYYDLDEHGNKRPDRYLQEEISTDYVNKLLIRDFERLFRTSPLAYELHPVPFGSWYARWTRPFLRVPWLQEFVTGYIWVVLRKKPVPSAQEAAMAMASGH